MRTTLLLGFLLTWALALSAQEYCRPIFKKAQNAYEQGRLEDALTLLKDAEVCDFADTLLTERQQLYDNIFAAIEKQRTAARTSLQKANRLAGYFNFTGARAAWAYNVDSARFALINREGKKLTAFIYDNPEPFRDGLAIARVNNQFVFLDEEGKERSKRYDFVMETDIGYWFGGWVTCDFDFQWLSAKRTAAGVRLDIAFKTGRLHYENGRVWVAKEGQLGNIDFGVIDSTGAFLIPPKFDGGTLSPPKFQNGRPWVQKENGKWGYIDSSGAFLIQPQFDDARDFQNGRAQVKINGKWGWIDNRGVFLIQPQFDDASDFKNGHAWVLKNDKLGVIDITGVFPLLSQIDGTLDFQNGRAQAQNDDGKWGYIDSSGAFRIIPHLDVYPELEFFEAWIVEYDRGLVMVGGKQGLIDTLGNILIPCHYTTISPCAYDTWITEQNGRLGLYSGHYRISIPAEYEEFGLLNEEGGWIRARRNGKWGWIDRQGKVMIPFRYDAAAPFFNGKAEVRQEPYPEFFEINRKGQVAVK